MTNALVGGGIIGLAVSLMLIFNGRVTGISGIISGAISPQKDETFWRWAFLIGLISGGFIIRILKPEILNLSDSLSYFDYALAGFLVGFGTLLGNGCTSGHGVCGISRFSMRSIIATVTFISFGVISVLIFKSIKGIL